MACFGNEPRSFCHFWGCTTVVHFRLFCWLWGLLYFFYGILVHSGRYNDYLNWIHPLPSILVHSFLRCQCLFFHLLFDHIQFALIHGPKIPGSYAKLFFAASDFTFITRHIHSWKSFPLWPSHFILSGAISSCPPLFPSSILGTFRARRLIFQCHIFLSFM